MEFDLAKVKRKMLRKYPAFGSTISNIKYEQRESIGTAATDGKKIVYCKKFLDDLPEEEQVFVLAHEVCHVALDHLIRAKDKDMQVWNIATDAVINQYLQKDGLPMIKGGVDIKEAINYDSEKVYNFLMEEKQKRENKQSQNQNSSQNEGGNGQNGQSNNSQQNQGQNEQNSSSNQNNQNSENNQQQNSQNQAQNSDGNGENSQQSNETNSNEKDEKIKKEIQEKYDDLIGKDCKHEMWENPEDINDLDESGQNSQANSQNENQTPNNQKPISEKDQFNENKKMKEELAKQAMDKIKNRMESAGPNSIFAAGEIQASKPIVNWKKMLVKYLELEDEAWGYRFSDSSNGYRARIEDVEFEERAQTEVILDVSGSVSKNLLLSFLKQLKHLLKDGEIKVGTFSGSFHGWQEIKKASDIDKLVLDIGGGTNFDAASRAFSKGRDINRICFTDGDDGGDAGIREKRKDIIWISFENQRFKPDNGKVIYVSPEQINCLAGSKNSFENDNGMEL